MSPLAEPYTLKRCPPTGRSEGDILPTTAGAPNGACGCRSQVWYQPRRVERRGADDHEPRARAHRRRRVGIRLPERRAARARARAAQASCTARACCAARPSEPGSLMVARGAEHVHQGKPCVHIGHG